MDSTGNLIPIKNLYYILCYAWNLAEQLEKIKVNAEDCKTYPDLFGKLLVRGCSLLFKRGLHHEYIEHEDVIYGIKGKWNVSKSVASPSYRMGLMDCSYDDYSDDILVNQIIYASLRRLIGLSELNSEIKKDVTQIYNRFPNITLINLSKQVFDDVIITSDNRFYGLIVHICELIYEVLLPEEEEGKYHFMNFSQKRMNNIFEDFLRNFYKKECAEEYPKVERSQIKYQLETISGSKSILPIMETDVTMCNEESRKKIIIDAKYYMETLVSRYSENVQGKVRNGHINQLLSYILNQENPNSPCTMNSKGILVYPKTNTDLNYTGIYKHTQHKIRFATIDLNEEWWQIEKRLKEIIIFKDSVN